MAPTPSATATSAPTATAAAKASEGKWSTASIVGVSFFVFFLLAFAITVAAYYYHRRAERNKLPPEARPTSYHPFRTLSHTDKSGLLANAAPDPEDDKRSMFSRKSRSSVSLYVDSEHGPDRRSMDTVSLIPLHITPGDEVDDPMDNSTGSGVTASSTSTRGSLGLSTIPVPQEQEQDLGVPKTRVRSSSAASARYYEVTPTETTPPVQIPKIVHTPSD
ncbi:hypothetical protein EJ04DRAFT_264533 [Polyplosphaeria fusca]|uniref:Transmembrane protein n=1 Tax=Polyplosphaeria fusca TaxID=682080 RepID=A0A9P4RB60_9PLEO|nr:hypothetical protein EJ04DRAFT_264533 [Polyplosphaeria fusca]